MKNTSFTEDMIMAVLREAESGVCGPDVCRTHGISTASFYKWRAKYGGMDASMMSQMKAIEEENRLPKCMFADLTMQADLLREALAKKQRGQRDAERWPREQWRPVVSASRWPVWLSRFVRPAFAIAQGEMPRMSGLLIC